MAEIGGNCCRLERGGHHEVEPQNSATGWPGLAASDRGGPASLSPGGIRRQASRSRPAASRRDSVGSMDQFNDSMKHRTRLCRRDARRADGNLMASGEFVSARRCEERSGRPPAEPSAIGSSNARLGCGQLPALRTVPPCRGWGLSPLIGEQLTCVSMRFVLYRVLQCCGYSQSASFPRGCFGEWGEVEKWRRRDPRPHSQRRGEGVALAGAR